MTFTQNHWNPTKRRNYNEKQMTRLDSKYLFFFEFPIKIQKCTKVATSLGRHIPQEHTLVSRNKFRDNKILLIILVINKFAFHKMIHGCISAEQHKYGAREYMEFEEKKEVNKQYLTFYDTRNFQVYYLNHSLSREKYQETIFNN